MLLLLLLLLLQLLLRLQLLLLLQLLRGNLPLLPLALRQPDIGGRCDSE